MPALRFDKKSFDEERERALRLVDEASPCGFLIFGGEAARIFNFTTELNSRAGRKLLFAADLEYGAGQQFKGLTSLPSPSAIAASQDAAALACLAGRLTAKEALSVGVNLIFAPLCDVNIEPANPIINVRSFGADPKRVGELVASWIHGAQAAGAYACAKHFPGHGGTITDSHAELPVGPSDSGQLYRVHLEPFRAAFEAGVKAVMTAHMTVPAVDGSGLPATLSPVVVGEILRKELRFSGIVVTDALIMAGIGMTEEEAAVKAVKAGCDIILYPSDPLTILAALEASGHDPDEGIDRIEEIHDLEAPLLDLISSSAPTLLRGTVVSPETFMIICDDERLDPEPFRRASIAAGWREVKEGEENFDPKRCVTAVYAMPGAWRGRCGPSDECIARIPKSSGVVSFGDPYFLRKVEASYAIAAYDDHPLLQISVVGKLKNREQFTGRFPL